MAKYSSYFDFGTGPELKTGVGLVKLNGMFNGGTRFENYDYVDDGSQNEEAANRFDKIMAGHDAASNEYVNKLKTIYDGYSKYAAEFGQKAEPIMKALTGDIKGMQRYIKDYDKLLGEIRPTMMDGIQLDPNATRTREEYQGNLAAAYGKQREQLAHDMASQGLNYYANRGGAREMSLAESAGQTNAANQAYKDWRTQYNQDVQAKQRGQAMFADLSARKGDQYGKIMDARGNLLGAHANTTQFKIGAEQAKAGGYENLLGLAENRRQEALSLGQQQQENQRYNNDIKQQLGAKLTDWDKQMASGTARSVY